MPHVDRQPAQLSASLMCARLRELGAEVERLEEAGIDSLHLDIMDGHFVPNLALSTEFVAAIRPLTRMPIHVHLMTEHAERYVERLAAAGADVVFFHLEATRAPLGLAKEIADLGMVPGPAIAPATPPPSLPELLALPHLLIMAVEPGFAGQPWVRSTVDRVRTLRQEMAPSGMITVDGHVNERTIGKLWRAGADNFVCGSSGLFTSPTADYTERASSLRAAIRDEARRSEEVLTMQAAIPWPAIPWRAIPWRALRAPARQARAW